MGEPQRNAHTAACTRLLPRHYPPYRSTGIKITQPTRFVIPPPLHAAVLPAPKPRGQLRRKQHPVLFTQGYCLHATVAPPPPWSSRHQSPEKNLQPSTLKILIKQDQDSVRQRPCKRLAKHLPARRKEQHQSWCARDVLNFRHVVHSHRRLPFLHSSAQDTSNQPLCNP